MAKKKIVEENGHPSLNGYVPSEPIPDGYKLDRVTYVKITGIDSEFAVEWIIPIAEVAIVEKENKAA